MRYVGEWSEGKLRGEPVCPLVRNRRISTSVAVRGEGSAAGEDAGVVGSGKVWSVTNNTWKEDAWLPIKLKCLSE